MIQVKLFIGREDHTRDLEEEVNDWLVESGAKVLSITGNIAPQSVLPSKETSSNLAGAGTHSRRFAPSDIMLLVQYEKA